MGQWRHQDDSGAKALSLASAPASRLLGAAVAMALSATSCPSSTSTSLKEDAGPTEVEPYVMPTRDNCGGPYAGLPTVLGHLQQTILTEVSGVVPSATTPDLYWVHNDSGDDPILYAIGGDGRPRGQFRLPLPSRDIEDIAIASCPGRDGPCLYIADTGNNSGTRDDTAIYVVAEPSLGADGSIEAPTDISRIDVSTKSGLPTGVDSEALVVLPDASALLFFEKVDAEFARVFVLSAPFVVDAVEVVDEGESPPGDASTNTLRMIGTVRTESPSVQFGRMITGADLHPDGSRLVVRTYTGVFEARFGSDQSALDLASVPLATVTFGPFSEPQGEAIAYDLEGTGLITISEAKDKPATDVAINLLACQ